MWNMGMGRKNRCKMLINNWLTKDTSGLPAKTNVEYRLLEPENGKKIAQKPIFTLK